MQNNSFVIHTDGACKGNPGQGGWGAVIEQDGNQTIISGGEPHTTNNRMELHAVIQGLNALATPCRVRIYTDSEYVCKGMTSWIGAWKRRNWTTVSGRPVKNKDLWLALDDAQSPHTVEWRWVRGHAGNTGNERADGLANAAIDQSASTEQSPEGGCVDRL